MAGSVPNWIEPTQVIKVYNERRQCVYFLFRGNASRIHCCCSWAFPQITFLCIGVPKLYQGAMFCWFGNLPHSRTPNPHETVFLISGTVAELYSSAFLLGFLGVRRMAGVLAPNARRETAVADLRAIQVQLQFLEIRRQLVGHRREATVTDLLPRSILFLTVLLSRENQRYAGCNESRT